LEKAEKKMKPLSLQTGFLWFLVCLGMAWGAVALLRETVIPQDERDCYRRVEILQKAVDRWNRQNPKDPMTEDIDFKKLSSAGMSISSPAYDVQRHYYFVGETAHGLRVKCNRHQDNPLSLKWTGVVLLGLVLFAVSASLMRRSLFPPEP